MTEQFLALVGCVGFSVLLVLLIRGWLKWRSKPEQAARRYAEVWIVWQDGRVHSVHATREHANLEKGENLTIPETPWAILGSELQPQAVSAGALYASGEMVRCSQCLMPLSGAPESHLPDCKVRELQEQHEANLLASHDQKVRTDALEEAALAVTGVHTSYHHNDPAETIGTFVRRHSAAIQERIRSLASIVEKETK